MANFSAMMILDINLGMPQIYTLLIIFLAQFASSALRCDGNNSLDILLLVAIHSDMEVFFYMLYCF